MGNGDSRTLFRDQVHQLLNSENCECSGLFLFPENLEDVLSMLPISDVQMLQMKRPSNLQQVTDKALEVLEQLKDEKDQTPAVNAARVLCRILATTSTSPLWWGRERRGLRLLNILVYYQLDPGRKPALDVQKLLLVTASCSIAGSQPDLWRWVLCAGSIPSTDNLFERLLLGATEPLTSWWSRLYEVELRETTLLVLLALLDFRPRNAEGELNEPAQTLLENGELSLTNIFAENLASFNRPDWLNHVTRGLLGAVLNYCDVKNAVLPTRQLPFQAEALLLLTRLLRNNSVFLDYFSQQPTAVSILRPVLELMTGGETGVVAAGCACLLRLCTVQVFLVALHAQYLDRSSAPWVLFTGSYADLLVVGICHVIREHEELVLREHLAAILANSGTQLQKLSTEAGLQVAQVLGCLTLKSWLFASPSHYRPLQLLLSFCRGQVGCSPDFVEGLASKELVLEVIVKLKAPIIEPEPAEDLTWKPSQLWLDKVKVRLGADILMNQLKNGNISVDSELFMEIPHLSALESRWFWVNDMQKQMEMRLGSVFN